MPVIPYVKQGAPFADTTGSAGTVNAAKLNAVDIGIYEAHLQPAVCAYNNAAISITTSGVTQWLTFNSERFDQAGGSADTMHDTVTNSGRLTCRYAGVYQITGSVEFAANATGLRWIEIRHQGTTSLAVQSTTNLGAGIGTNLVVTRLYPLAVNEYVELGALQTSGGALNVNSTANRSPEFMMVRVG